MKNLVEDYAILRRQADTTISDVSLKKAFRDNDYDVVKTLLSLDGFVENSCTLDFSQDDSNPTIKKIAELREIVNAKDAFLMDIVKNNK
jgi:hypothetical protein